MIGPLGLEVVLAPRSGLWRVGRSPDPLDPGKPLSPDDLSLPHVGNRFDSPLGNYSVLYFGTDLHVCFGETLARFRPDVELIALIGEEWDKLGHMAVGAVPADWRERRFAVQVRVPDTALFVDVEQARTRKVLRQVLAPILASLGVKDLDVAAIRSGDRRVTRWVSQWTWSAAEGSDPLFSGIRYVSRLHSSWEAWAIFADRVELTELDRLAITKDLPEIREIAELFDLVVH